MYGMALRRQTLKFKRWVILGVCALAAMPSAAQVLKITAQEVQVSGVTIRNVSGQLNVVSQAARMDTDRARYSLSAALAFDARDRHLSRADLRLHLQAALHEQGWQIRLRPTTLPIRAIPDLMANAELDIEIFGRLLTRPERVNLRLRTRDLQYADESGTTAAESLHIDSSLTFKPAPTLTSGEFALEIRSDQGAALARAVYLDFAAQPLHAMLQGHVRLTDQSIHLATDMTLRQENLLAANGKLQARMDRTFTDPALSQIQIEQADLTLDSLQFPAAYQSLFRTALAGTLLGNLDTSGHLSGRLTIEHDRPTAAGMTLHAIKLHDVRNNALSIENLSGSVHWRNESAPNNPLSEIDWQAASVNGIPLGASSLMFLWEARQISLAAPSRIPILDGALRIETLAVRELLTPDQDFVFDGVLDPLSLTALTAAVGWPSLGGTLKGRAPGVRYRDRQISLDGALEADVFDGRIIVRDLQLDDAFGRWPRLTANIDIESLDLALLTSTFDIGEISGRIGGRVRNLELFAWQPVAFDATVATVEDAPEPRRISVRAINSIANIGGNAGSGVGAALQTGLLRFFDSYRYRRLGLRCTLRNDVCLMSGVNENPELRFGDRYLLLEGAGLPRINITGYTGRVKWSQLVRQVGEQIRSGAAPVRLP